MVDEAPPEDSDVGAIGESSASRSISWSSSKSFSSKKTGSCNLLSLPAPVAGCVRFIMAFFNPCSWLENGESLPLACDAVRFKDFVGGGRAVLIVDKGRGFKALAFVL